MMAKCLWCNKEVKHIGGKVYLDKYSCEESGLYINIDGHEIITCDDCFEVVRRIIPHDKIELENFYKKVIEFQMEKESNKVFNKISEIVIENPSIYNYITVDRNGDILKWIVKPEKDILGNWGLLNVPHEKTYSKLIGKLSSCGYSLIFEVED